MKIYEVEKKGMMKHSVMTLNEKECDNICGNKYPKMNKMKNSVMALNVNE